MPSRIDEAPGDPGGPRKRRPYARSSLLILQHPYSKQSRYGGKGTKRWRKSYASSTTIPLAVIPNPMRGMAFRKVDAVKRDADREARRASTPRLGFLAWTNVVSSPRLRPDGARSLPLLGRNVWACIVRGMLWLTMLILSSSFSAKRAFGSNTLPQCALPTNK